MAVPFPRLFQMHQRNTASFFWILRIQRLDPAVMSDRGAHFQMKVLVFLKKMIQILKKQVALSLTFSLQK